MRSRAGMPLRPRCGQRQPSALPCGRFPFRSRTAHACPGFFRCAARSIRCRCCGGLRTRAQHSRCPSWSDAAIPWCSGHGRSVRRAGDRERACNRARRQARSRANRARGHRLPRDLNAMRILFVGDVVGRSGRNIVNERLPALVRDWRLDCVIVNGENAAGGFGITEPIYHELIDAGADAITLGNHAWDQREALVFIERAPRLIRPINYPAGTPGRGAALDDPFAAIDKELAACPLRSGADAIVIDLHAEATSEKQAMGYFTDGRASVVIGTHTHAPTADHQILPGGTAFISDVGMTGDYYSVIGMNKQEPLQRFLRRIPSAKFEPALGAATLCGLAVETDDRTGLAIRVGGRLEEARPAFWG